jgi:hypothetical protein
MQSKKLLFTTVKQLRDFKSEETPPASFTFGASISANLRFVSPPLLLKKSSLHQ